MNIELVGKDLPLTEMLRERLELKLGKIESRLGTKLFVRVKLQGERNSRFSCAIHFNGEGHEFQAASSSDDLIKAVDDAIAKIERQVAKVHRHDHRPLSEPPAETETAPV